MPSQQEPKGAKPPLPGLVKMSFNMETNLTPASTASCIMHARWDDNINHPLLDLSQLGTYWAGQWDGSVFQAISHEWMMNGWTIQSLGGDGLLASGTDASVGGVASASFPPNVSVCVSLRSGITARGGRGRIYLAGIPIADSPDSGGAQITNAAATNFKTQVLNMINAVSTHFINGHVVFPGIPSYYTKYTLRPIPSFFPITGTSCSLRLDSQRRRLGKERNFARV